MYNTRTFKLGSSADVYKCGEECHDYGVRKVPNVRTKRLMQAYNVSKPFERIPLDK